MNRPDHQSPAAADEPADDRPDPRLYPSAMHTVIGVIASALGAVLMVLLGTLLPAKARAAELEGWTIGSQLAAWHLPRADGAHTATPGAYLLAPNGAALGLMRNSLGRTSAWAALAVDVGPAQLLLGGITGYRRQAQGACDAAAPSGAPTMHRLDAGSNAAPAATTTASSCSAPQWSTRVKGEVAPLVALSVVLPVQAAGLRPRLTLAPGSRTDRRSLALALSAERRF